MLEARKQCSKWVQSWKISKKKRRRRRREKKDGRLPTPSLLLENGLHWRKVAERQRNRKTWDSGAGREGQSQRSSYEHCHNYCCQERASWPLCLISSQSSHQFTRQLVKKINSWLCSGSKSLGSGAQPSTFARPSTCFWSCKVWEPQVSAPRAQPSCRSQLLS